MTRAYEKFQKIGQDSCGDKKYRYRLHRSCSDDSAIPIQEMEKKTLCYILLNPSTAVGEDVNDRTVKRCLNLASAWGYAFIEIVNLYAFRATDPMLLIDEISPIGDRNDECLKLVSKSNMDCVAAWDGMCGPQRVLDVLKLFEENSGGKRLKCITKPSDSIEELIPRHPSRCSADCRLTDWQVDSNAYRKYKDKKQKIVCEYQRMILDRLPDM